MEEDTEFTKLPLEERCVHKLWKARVHGYEEAAKLFRQIPDEKAPEWNKYLGIVKKFAADSNAAAQEKGLEAILAYIENAGPAGKTVGEVMSNIVTKCLSAPRTKTKELSQQVTLMYVEIEKHEAVMEELIKGFDQKNPKVVAACINTATMALNEFGMKVINVKPLVKEVPKLLDHRDKIVRDEGKALIVEIYRWVGVAVKPQLSNLKPVQLTELEAEFEKVAGEKVVPTRYLRSQQQKQQVAAVEEGEGDEVDAEEEDEAAAPAIDPLELIDPVDILSKLPKDFYEKLEAKKWQERKEAMDELEKLVQNPKLEGGDYGELVRALKKIIQKDSNVMIVALAGKCVAGLANGLKKKFQPYASACVSCILEKFKEKKQNVVTAMREAIDAVTQNLTLETMLEDITEAIEKNKNPAVKSETSSFLTRYFSRCTPQMLDKKMLKAYVPLLLKALNDPDATVRDSAAEALGTAMKAVTEKSIMPFIGDLDNIKMQKIKECCEKAVMTVKIPKSARPATAPAKVVAKPASAPPPKKPTGPKKVLSGGAKAAKPAAKKQAAASTVSNFEREMADEEVEAIVSELLPPQLLNDLVDANWKTRLAGAEQLLQLVSNMDKSDMQAQALVKTLSRKPGLKDNNFQVMKAKLDVVKAIAESPKFTRTSANLCLQDVAEKLGDAKTGVAAAEVLTTIADNLKLDFVATEVLSFGLSQKSPKIQQESMAWLSNAIKEYGFVIQPKPVLENIRKALASTNVAVRTSAISLLCTLYLYMGDTLRRIMESEKPAIVQQINAEFDKLEGQRPPTPIKGMTVSTGEDNSESVEDDQNPDPDNLQELLPRVDISGQFTDAIISQLSDTNWKMRDEALQKVSTIVNANAYVTANLGELPAALAKRLTDSNKIICQSTFTICRQLGEKLGAQCKQHIRTLMPSMLQGLSDSKSQVRSLAMDCIKVWAEQSGLKEIYEGEMIADALKTGNPFLKAELFQWMAESLTNAKKISKEDLIATLPHLMAAVEDRNADVRKNAQDAVLPIMIHVGFEPMARQSQKLSAASRTAVTTMLEKARASLPAKPAAPPKAAAKGAPAKGKLAPPAAAPAKINTNTITKSKPTIAKPSATSRNKKEDDQDLSPLLQVNNLKTQRMADEQKLRVLKWNFTTPRDEFVDLLKDQMTTAAVNKSLMDKMFHNDFKFHLKAIDALNEFLNVNPQATVSNLDLILKWLTLRFFDTNPSVLLRGLEYLLTVFAMLAEDGYNMPEMEASSFIPYLILKSGDPKDTVRNGVKNIMHQITLIYPCSRLFAYVMEGLKSKNSRQRTECLEELGLLIDNYGISVSQPTPAAALKEIARQISDRDNSVRTAALNCVVQAWHQEGEKIYKMIGQISDKELSLLQERIKRAGKTRPVIKTAVEVAASRPTKAVRPNAVAQEVAERYSEPEEVVEPTYSYEDLTEAGSSALSSRTGSVEEIILSSGSSLEVLNPRGSNSLDSIKRNLLLLDLRMNRLGDSPVSSKANPSHRQRPISAAFRLDYDLLEDLENGPSVKAPQLLKMDLDDIGNDVRMPRLDPAKHMITSPLTNRSGATATVELHIGRLCNHNLDRSIEACKEVEMMMRREASSKTLVAMTDQVLVAITNQLQVLQKATAETHDLQLMSVNYTLLIAILRSIFSSPQMATRASQAVIRDVMSSLLLMLVEQKLERFNTEDQIVRLTNSLVVRIIENADHTRLVTAQVRMLHDCISNPNTHPKFTELVMKSLWKVMRVIEQWQEQLDLAAVLREVNHFLVDFPSHTWRDRKDLTPLKTIKTLVHTMVQFKGATLLTYLNKEDTCNELSKIVNKYISTSAPKLGDRPAAPREQQQLASPHRLSKTTHHQLSAIFKKIGSKDQTREGLEQLYDFQKMNPDADIAPFLEKASQFFQEYIEKGLKTIETDRSRQGSTAASSISSPQETPSESGVELGLYLRQQNSEDGDMIPASDKANYYKEKLKALQHKAGLGANEESMDNRVDDMNRNHAQKELLDNLPRSVLGESNLSSPPKQTDAASLELIKQRLERLKR
ncbi:protein mini spindles isoform X2 [Neocloeon triangulifer]|uniref:protein mini spindles isoform X2 n=1 Tax=Neocloeon triangulifer TaxID=2078957 RepID=UPI00286F8276|nr:protein mini spindles isoform X2 [Neocloeon triangulifer]